MRSIQFQFIALVTLLLALATTGCDQPGDSGASDMDNLANQLEQHKQAEQAAIDAAAAAKAKADEEAARAAQAAEKAVEEQLAPAADNETTVTNTVKSPPGQITDAETRATVDGIVGKKQRRNRVEGPLRYYGANANARIIAMDRTLGWQIKSALDVYVNGENDGKYPQTTEEFMEKIIAPNGIVLPELEPNQEYFYDPEDHELKIGEPIDEPAATTSGAAKSPAEAPPAAE